MFLGSDSYSSYPHLRERKSTFERTWSSDDGARTITEHRKKCMDCRDLLDACLPFWAYVLCRNESKLCEQHEQRPSNNFYDDLWNPGGEKKSAHVKVRTQDKRYEKHRKNPNVPLLNEGSSASSEWTSRGTFWPWPSWLSTPKTIKETLQ